MLKDRDETNHRKLDDTHVALSGRRDDPNQFVNAGPVCRDPPSSYSICHKRFPKAGSKWSLNYCTTPSSLYGDKTCRELWLLSLNLILCRRVGIVLCDVIKTNSKLCQRQTCFQRFLSHPLSQSSFSPLPQDTTTTTTTTTTPLFALYIDNIT